MRMCLSCWFVVAALLAPLSTAAAPFEDPTMDGAVFTGPTHAHPSSIYVSPSALALASSGWHLHVGTSLRRDQFRVRRTPILDPDGGAPQMGPEVATGLLTPAGLVAGYYRSEQVGIGLALYTPTAERFLSHQDFRYHTLGGEHYQFAASLATAFRAHRRVLIGTGLSLVSSWLRLSFSRDTALEAGSGPGGVGSDCGGAPCGIENPQAAERYDIRVDAGGVREFVSLKNIALSVGVMVELLPKWWLATSYISPPGFLSGLRLPGTVTVYSAPRAGDAVYTGQAEVIYYLPQTLHAALRAAILPEHELVVAVRWQSLSDHRELDIRLFGGNLAADVPSWYPRYRGFRDVWRFSVGLERDEKSRFRYGLRLRGETGAVTEPGMSPLQIAGHNATLALGGQVRVGNHLVLTAGYDLTWFPTVAVTDSAFDPGARIACVDSRYDFDVCAAARQGRAIPSAAGSYARLQHAAALSVRWDFL